MGRSQGLPSAASVRAPFTSWDHTIAKDAPTRKGSAPCVGRRFWTPRITNRPLSDCVVDLHSGNQDEA